jgi:hypothetical protein
MNSFKKFISEITDFFDEEKRLIAQKNIYQHRKSKNRTRTTQKTT